jgi:peptidoglycan/xylan/chitin deacetylase (PgdA/CDA1 family)
MKKMIFTILFLIQFLAGMVPVYGVSETVRLPVIMYHHISTEASAWGPYVISPEELDADLCYLKTQGYETITVQQLLDWQSGNCELPDKPIMLTFDDGYESTAVYGVPILEKYGYQAVVAVIGAVAQAYTNRPDHTIQYSHMDWDTIRRLSWGGTLEVQYHTWDMHEVQKGTRDGCLPKSGESPEEYRQALCEDVNMFYSACKEWNVSLCRGVAYPFGLYSSETEQLLQNMGFQCAFTCEEHINMLTGDPAELYRLGRFNRPHGISSETFFSNIEI